VDIILELRIVLRLVVFPDCLVVVYVLDLCVLGLEFVILVVVALLDNDVVVGGFFVVLNVVEVMCDIDVVELVVIVIPDVVVADG